MPIWPRPFAALWSNSASLPAPPAAAPSVRGTPTTGTGAPVLPDHESGDVLVVLTTHTHAASDVTASGWTRHENRAASTFFRGYAFSRVAQSAGDTITLSANPTCYTAYAVQDATGVDVSASASQGGGGTTRNCPSVTPTVAPTLLVDAVGANMDDGATAITMPDGETPATLVTDGGNSIMLRCGSKVLATTDPTGTRAATLDEVALVAMVAVVVK